MAIYLLDASALLAWMGDEDGADYVDSILEESAISSVDLGVALCKADRSSHQAADIMALGLQVIPFSASHALELPDLRFADAVRREEARSRGDRAQSLYLADMCCLATGIIEKLTVVTGDTYWWEIPLPTLALIDYRAP
jgi:ribonuclease VapC